MARTRPPAAPVPWAELLADPKTRRRYEEKIYRRRADQCWYWLGAVSDSGHGKLRAGSRTDKTSQIVTAHALGFAIVYGVEQLLAADVVRHGCDSPSCLNPAHWLAGTRAQNAGEYAARSRTIGHTLTDERGPAGRARAIRDAIKAALAAGADVEGAIERAVIAGQPGGALQIGLW
ncbi:hypothetical protein DR950_41735 [Kitasatospora xanthocidica]|uniref:HNH endonuclease n=1 Tax=Kitasatospora xanthocidica TaxID=83382 RepID=A0A372ZJE8_9ACTN|nr:hypothetical protein [Kitasatospora xanthocidica]RGD55387.1 hypothetical protein DR950_41735 [Kitasatospora xanthocidica]